MCTVVVGVFVAAATVAAAVVVVVVAVDRNSSRRSTTTTMTMMAALPPAAAAIRVYCSSAILYLSDRSLGPGCCVGGGPYTARESVFLPPSSHFISGHYIACMRNTA